MKSKAFRNYLFVLTAMAVFTVFRAPYAPAREEGGIDLAVEADRTEVHIGDLIELRVTAAAGKGVEIAFPDMAGDPGDFTFVKSRPIRPGFGRPDRKGMVYVFTIYSTGEYVIPPLTVRYRKDKDDEWARAETPGVPVKVRSLLTGDDEDIRELKGLFLRGVGLRTVLKALLLLLAAGAVITAVWIRKRRIRAEEERARNRTADEIAYEELGALKAMDLPGKGLTKEYYIRLSDIARRYLENRFAIKAPEMTTEEFLDWLRDSSLLETGHKDLLRDFLSRCDLVKFARYGPTQLEILDSFKAAERLVDQTKLTEVA